MANLGLYGTAQGNERRGAGSSWVDHLADNQIVEGDHVAVLRRMCSERDWAGVTRFTDKLRKAGHSKTRVDSMLSRAMAGLTF